ncbi:MAG: cellulase family glycosylhydrolase [Myxococcota bacterium]|nr:cellulase family glycosylhydrolase [Myxococcota bacterium]
MPEKTPTSNVSAAQAARWSVGQARQWWEEQDLPVGCNFSPSTAINQLEMWQAETFDLATIDRELGWGAKLGFNTMRIYLHDLLWEQDSQGFLGRIDRVLGCAEAHGIRVLPVLFDDVWNPNPKLGPQPEPHPGRHNSGWVQGPGLPVLQAYPDDPTIPARLANYVKGVVGHFSDDARILMWDVYNEPGGYTHPGGDRVGEACLPLLADVFEWTRSQKPTQPLTSGLWSSPIEPLPEDVPELQLAGSDIVSFHHYGPPDDLVEFVGKLEETTQRPLFCTEYLARQMKSLFQTHLPIFSERRIGAINWGLVSGRTQTICPWWSWFEDEPPTEPEIWFHDILRADGTPFDPEEESFLRVFLGASNPNADKPSS